MKVKLPFDVFMIVHLPCTYDCFYFHQLALELLDWNRNEVNTLCMGKLYYTQPTDHLWAKKGKSLKFMPIMGLLMTLGKVGIALFCLYTAVLILANI